LKECLTTEETMEFMQVSLFKLRKLVKDGRIKPVKISPHRNMYKREDILTCLIGMRTER
jgi:predicted site-specific integrase-resolvase